MAAHRQLSLASEKQPHRFTVTGWKPVGTWRRPWGSNAEERRR